MDVPVPALVRGQGGQDLLAQPRVGGIGVVALMPVAVDLSGRILDGQQAPAA